jgi:hypothetical protein
MGSDGDNVRSSETGLAFNKNLLADYDNNSLVVTIKNYNTNHGLSKAIHDSV